MPETKAVPALLRALNSAPCWTRPADGPISRASLPGYGISRPTVSIVLRSLLDDGLVRRRSTTRAAHLRHEADPEAAVVIGVDFGSRAVRTALCDPPAEFARGIRAGSGRMDRACQAREQTSRRLPRTPAVVSPADGRARRRPAGPQALTCASAPGAGPSRARDARNDVNLARSPSNDVESPRRGTRAPASGRQ